MDEPSHECDQALLRAIGEGDEAAFETLYRRHRDWVLRLAHRFTRDEAMAMDVTQEVFMHLLGRAGTLELRAKLTTYLYSVTRRTSLATLRQRRGGPAIDETSLEGAVAPAPDDLAPIARALEALTPTQREVLLMRVVHEMALADIAEALRIPVGTVKSRLHGAMRAVREGR